MEFARMKICPAFLPLTEYCGKINILLPKINFNYHFSIKNNISLTQGQEKLSCMTNSLFNPNYEWFRAQCEGQTVSTGTNKFNVEFDSQVFSSDSHTKPSCSKESNVGGVMQAIQMPIQATATSFDLLSKENSKDVEYFLSDNKDNKGNLSY